MAAVSTLRWVLAASVAQDRLRTLLAVLAIALGVALGFAVQMINRAAVNELARGVQALAGEADLQVRGARGGFDEALYPVLARYPGVAVASPVVEVDARIAGTDESLRIVGLDLFRAAQIQPGLVPEGAARLDMLRPDVVFPSTPAAQWLGTETGRALRFQAGTGVVALRVGGVLGPAVSQRLAVMDIAGAQTRFGRPGILSRIDLRLAAGIDVDRFAAGLAPELPPGVVVARPETTVAAGASLSRAYRVNLNVLALVALFTGGLLVFSTQALAVVRRRSQLALLRVLGVTRRELVALLIGEGVVVGAAGSVVGLAAGYGLAVLALRVVGADLGSGYFRGVVPRITVEPWAALVFLLLGTLTAVAGSALPALEAARAAPAQALKAGDEARPFARVRRWRPGVAVVLLGAVLTLLPPWAGLPVFGYLSIALLLIGTLLLLPWLAAAAWQRLPVPRAVPVQLALAQLRGAPGQAAVSLASIVASVALMVSMGIMVFSFRGSLDAWLERVLPADLYVRAAPRGDSGYLPEALQQRMRTVEGVRRIDFIREQPLVLDTVRAPVVLVARDLDAGDPGRTLPLIAPAPPLPRNAAPPVWINEPAAALYGLRVGDAIDLPLAGRAEPFTIAGIWRDYARQQGALVVERARYVALTGDASANTAAVWLAAGADAVAVRLQLAALAPDLGELDVAVPQEIRAASLRAFDRTFAVTYALELAAVLIGLVGLSSAFGALVLARRREFGMLRHLGVLRGQIAAMLASEGLLVSGLGMGVGVGLGWLMSLVLIHVVNRQSFHWGMELAIPWTLLALAVVLVLGLSVLTAVASGRIAMGRDVVRAVREDW
ncbi:MAG: FtsX-like permease family protein [Casimicrobiaceae bacterium]